MAAAEPPDVLDLPLRPFSRLTRFCFLFKSILFTPPPFLNRNTTPAYTARHPFRIPAISPKLFPRTILDLESCKSCHLRFSQGLWLYLSQTLLSSSKSTLAHIWILPSGLPTNRSREVVSVPATATAFFSGPRIPPFLELSPWLYHLLNSSPEFLTGRFSPEEELRRVASSIRATDPSPPSLLPNIVQPPLHFISLHTGGVE